VGSPLYAANHPPLPNLELLVRNLDLDTARCKRVMRQYLEDQPDAFLKNAVRLLLKQPENHGTRYILGLLAERGLLLRVLCMPGFTGEQALAMARAAIAAAPAAEAVLARGFAELLEEAGTADDLENVTRLMEILVEVCDGARIFPSMVRLLRHPNPHLRSKAVLVLGRHSRSTQWVRHRLDDTDPRIRANALEALWNVDTPEAHELLHGLIHDANNRVAGNALLGLYRLGQTSAIAEIFAMAEHESPIFRATAAWVMGETGDPRFMESLAGLLTEPDATVRKRAFAALGQVRMAAAKAGQGAPYRLAARVAESSPALVRVLLAVTGANAYAAPEVLPTQILVTEGARQVVAYRIMERPLPETISAAFLLPAHGERAPWREAALACLPWKRPSDLWACQFYAPAEGAGPVEELSLRSGREQIQTEFARTPDGSEPGLWELLLGTLSIEGHHFPGRRHIMIFQDGPRGAPVEPLITAVAGAQAMLHVISAEPDPAMEEVCRRTGGVFSVLEDSGQAAEAAVQAYLHQFARYEISWQPLEGDLRQIKIRLHGTSACGETGLAVPPGWGI
jgi:hypothetical protein